MTQLKPFDPSNRQHVARQLHLVGRFGDYLTRRTDKLSPDSEQTLWAILETMHAYAAELARRLDNIPPSVTDLARVAIGNSIAIKLISAMLDAQPELERYDPNTPAQNLSETILSFLAHAVVIFGDTITQFEMRPLPPAERKQRLNEIRRDHHPCQ